MEISEYGPFETWLRTGGGLNLAPEAVRTQIDDLIGRDLSGYRVKNIIGRGGMGVVLEGERSDDQFVRRVAIKLISSDFAANWMAERFAQERQILAALNHPHIASLYDAGITDEGFPYLIMELIDGAPIHEYCQSHGSTLEEKLEYMMSVCSAVAYAHANLVVHRDIKPSNVMVDAQRGAQLLDFGIAKLMGPTDDASITVNYQPLTPKYASPEQLLGKPITTASDVYQLGLLLYRLTVEGPLPRGDSLSDAIEHAASGSPIKLSNAGSLPKELKSIVLRCLEHEPEHRYASAKDLADDLKRYLQGYPVSAGDYGPFYRMRKWVGRNQAFSAVLALATLITFGSTAWYNHNVNRARDLAESRAETTSRVLRGMTDLISESFEELLSVSASNEDGNSPGKLAGDAVRRVLAATESVIERELAEDSSSARAELLLTQAQIAGLLGESDRAEKHLLDALESSTLGFGSELEASIQISLTRSAITRSAVDDAEARLNALLELREGGALSERHSLEIDLIQGVIAGLRNDFETADAILAKAIQKLTALPASFESLLADAYYLRGDILSEASRLDEAIVWLERCLEIKESIHGPLHYSLITPLLGLGVAYGRLGHYPESENYFKRNLDLARANFGERGLFVAKSYANMGIAAMQAQRFDEAESNYKQSLRALSESTSGGTMDKAKVLVNLGNLYGNTGRPALAMESYEQAVVITDQLGEAGALVKAATLHNMASEIAKLGDFERAAQTALEAATMRQDLLGLESVRTARSYWYAAEQLARLGELESARHALNNAKVGYESTYGASSPDFGGDIYQAETKLLMAQGNYESALRFARKAVTARVSQLGETHVNSAYTMLLEVMICLELGQLDCAVAALDRARQGIKLSLDPPRLDSLSFLVLEARVHAHQGRFDVESLRRLLEQLETHYPRQESEIESIKDLLESAALRES